VLVGNRDGYHFDKQIDSEIEKLEKKVQEKIIFPGFVKNEDLPAIYTLAHIFISPSHYEGFGMPLLEAMSQGVPVIASDIPPHREVAGDAAVFIQGNSLASAGDMILFLSLRKDALRNCLRKLLRECVRHNMYLFRKYFVPFNYFLFGKC